MGKDQGPSQAPSLGTEGGAPLRVAFLTRSLNAGGAQTQLVALATGLAALGMRVRVLTYYPGGELAPQLVATGVEVATLAKRGRWDLIGFGRALVADLRRFNPRVLHSFLETSNVLTGLVRPWLPGTRIVWGLRSSNMDAGRYGLVWRLVLGAERLLAGRPDLIVANSRAGAAHRSAQGWPAGLMRVVPNGIDTERFRPRPELKAPLRDALGLPADALVMGQVARLDPMKDQATLLRALAQVAPKHPDLRLVVVGAGLDGYRAGLEGLTRDLGLDGRVLWLGERLDVADLYNAMDLHVLSSAYGEGFPNAVAEAMASGLPGVVTDVGDAAEIVADTGVRVPPTDPVALAEALDGLLSAPADLRQGIGRRARERVLAHYGLAAMVQHSAALYRELAGTD